ncbi:MAG: Ig-like domain-containing protein [bacterium]
MKKKRVFLISLATIISVFFFISLMSNRESLACSVSDQSHPLVVVEDTKGALIQLEAGCTYGYTKPAHGTVAFCFANTNLLYTPDPNYTGNDEFPYWLSTDTTNIKTITITTVPGGGGDTGGGDTGGGGETVTDQTPPAILEVHPVNLEKDAQGNIISDPVSQNASFAVLLSDDSGIDTKIEGSVEFTISYTTTDGEPKEYTRNLNNNDCMLVINKGDPVSDDSSLKKFWVRYDKSKDKTPSPSYPYDSEITISVTAKDIYDNAMPLAGYTFKTISEGVDLIEPTTTTIDNKKRYQIHNDQTLIGEIEIAKTEGVELKFIKGDQMPSYSRLKDDLGDVLVGEPIYVLTPLVLTEPATIRFYPDTENNIGGLGIYYTNGLEWVLACNTDGVVQAKANNWMLSGSRMNHNDEHPSIEIKVNHFSGIWLGEGNKIPGSTSDPGDPEGSYSSANTSGGEEDDSGMCFIKAVNF